MQNIAKTCTWARHTRIDWRSSFDHPLSAAPHHSSFLPDTMASRAECVAASYTLIAAVLMAAPSRACSACAHIRHPAIILAPRDFHPPICMGACRRIAQARPVCIPLRLSMKLLGQIHLSLCRDHLQARLSCCSHIRRHRLLTRTANLRLFKPPPTPGRSDNLRKPQALRLSAAPKTKKFLAHRALYYSPPLPAACKALSTGQTACG